MTSTEQGQRVATQTRVAQGSFWEEGLSGKEVTGREGEGAMHAAPCTGTAGANAQSEEGKAVLDTSVWSRGHQEE